MTPEDIVENWATACDAYVDAIGHSDWRSVLAEMIRQAIAEEREACAKLAEADISEYCAKCVRPSGELVFCESYGCHSLRDVAAAIRARASRPHQESPR